jgi:hypothetical protein
MEAKDIFFNELTSIRELVAGQSIPDPAKAAAVAVWGPRVKFRYSDNPNRPVSYQIRNL